MRSAVALVGCFVLGTLACSEKAPDEPPTEITRGMSRQSDDGLVSVTLADADPVPPLQGLNHWTVDVSNAGSPVVDEGDSDYQVIANIYMVEHDHNIRKIGTMLEPGTFEISDFTLTMNGYWEVTIEVWPDAILNDGDPSNDDEHEGVVFGFHVRN